jgi:hypothetical protein
VQQKRKGVEKITKIILLLMKIVEGMHTKIKLSSNMMIEV